MRIDDAADLGSLIRKRRQALRLSQGALAAQVGVSRQWLVEVERGKPRAEIGLVLRTLQALGVRLEAAARRRMPAGVLRRAPSAEVAPMPYAPGFSAHFGLDDLLDRARGKPR
ncbi:MAG: helix-turn-helix transcriptional regulator [Alphaproteobacteria bacterium]|nr:helix-turn-helix transcriptional regulator [Alphaproteobacteria bacterium]